MHPYSDEDLVAYADGELPPDRAAQIEAAAARDAALAARIARFTETRRLLQENFAPLLSEPVPARLLKGLAEPPPPVSARRPRRYWVPLSLAASVAFLAGVLAGVMWRGQSGAAAIEVAGLPADGRILQLALETRASGELLEDRVRGQRVEVMPTGTLRVASGAICREFESMVLEGRGQGVTRGLACRQGDGHWQLQALGHRGDAPAMRDDRYQTASGAQAGATWGLEGAVRLAPAEEDALLQAGWP